MEMHRLQLMRSLRRHCLFVHVQQCPLDRPADGERFIISVAQFRPEKVLRPVLPLRGSSGALHFLAVSSRGPNGVLLCLFARL